MLVGHLHIFSEEMSIQLFCSCTNQITWGFFVVVELWEFFIFWIFTPYQIYGLQIFSTGCLFIAVLLAAQNYEGSEQRCDITWTAFIKDYSECWVENNWKGLQKGKQGDDWKENGGLDEVGDSGDEVNRFGCSKDLFIRNQGWLLDFGLKNEGDTSAIYWEDEWEQRKEIWHA